MTACLLHEIIKAHTGSHHDRNLIESNIHILDEFYVGVQHRAGEIPGKKQIAAFSNVKQRLGQLVKVKAFKLFDVLILHKTLAGHLHPESVLRTQVIFQFDSHCFSCLFLFVCGSKEKLLHLRIVNLGRRIYHHVALSLDDGLDGSNTGAAGKYAVAGCGASAALKVTED